ncbi:hypothetical protein N7471_011528 [Penicillium samsonianum]|uniref:uncharacterized protein n=1 Tax=Penicillium samsonianum TaxID=1882272 RepID=UPI0025469D4F|nr:uncharacterized protein N7471_011528 [Penicillium samsonianum]KAJ6124211.1 hypothetical protein N7471_011528 [Penicillium samsonianum]
MALSSMGIHRIHGEAHDTVQSYGRRRYTSLSEPENELPGYGGTMHGNFTVALPRSTRRGLQSSDRNEIRDTARWAVSGGLLVETLRIRKGVSAYRSLEYEH